MHRIDHSTRDVDANGAGKDGFTEGSPGITPPTVVTDDWLNDFQENVAQAIEARGLALVKGTFTQLRDALQLLLAPSTSIAASASGTLSLSIGAASRVILTGLSSGDECFIHGIQGGVAGRVVALSNGTSGDIWIQSEGGAASAADRFSTPLSSKVHVGRGETVWCYYGTTRWNVLGQVVEREQQDFDLSAATTHNLNIVTSTLTRTLRSIVITNSFGADVTLTGIDIGLEAQGKNPHTISIINNNPTHNLILAHDTGSAADNRFFLASGNNRTMTPYAGLTLLRNTIDQRWHVLG